MHVHTVCCLLLCYGMHTAQPSALPGSVHAASNASKQDAWLQGCLACIAGSLPQVNN